MGRLFNPDNSAEQRIVSLADYAIGQCRDLDDYFSITSSRHKAVSDYDLSNWSLDEVSVAVTKFRDNFLSSSFMGLMMHLQSSFHLCHDNDFFETISKQIMPDIYSVKSCCDEVFSFGSWSSSYEKKVFSLADQIASVLISVSHFMKVVRGAYVHYIESGYYGGNPDFDPRCGVPKAITADGVGRQTIKVTASNLSEAIDKALDSARSNPDQFEMSYYHENSAPFVYQGAAERKQCCDFNIVVQRRDFEHYADYVKGAVNEHGVFDQLVDSIRNHRVHPLFVERSFQVVGVE